MVDNATSGLSEDDFLIRFRGSFTSALRWPQLDALWGRILAQPSGWYVYHVGEAPPDTPVASDGLARFVEEIDKLLREEHDEDYCGIVYADNLERPTMVKIYDPGNLGMVCGSSATPPLPGWVLSRIPPIDLPAQQPPRGRRRWWQRVLGRT